MAQLLDRMDVLGHDLADDEPVEQHADRGQLLLDRGGTVVPALLLDQGRDRHGPDRWLTQPQPSRQSRKRPAAQA